MAQYGAMMTSGFDRTRGSIEGVVVAQRESLNAAIQLSAQVKNLVRDLEGVGEQEFISGFDKQFEKMKEERDKFREVNLDTEDLDKWLEMGDEVYEARGRGDGEEELRLLQQLNRERVSAIEAIKVAAEGERAAKAKAFAETTQMYGTEFDMAKKLAESKRRVVAAELSAAQSFMQGLGVTYNLLMENLDAVGNVIEQVENKLKSQEAALAQHNAKMKEYEEERAKLEEGSAEYNNLTEQIEAEQTAINNLENERLQTQAERLGLVQEEINLTKELRYGYLSAMQSQAMAAGRFSKILFTREQNVSELLDMTSKRMRELEGEIRGYGGLVETIGGRIAPDEAKRREQMQFAQYGPGGIMNTRDLDIVTRDAYYTGSKGTERASQQYRVYQREKFEGAPFPPSVLSQSRTMRTPSIIEGAVPWAVRAREEEERNRYGGGLIKDLESGRIKEQTGITSSDSLYRKTDRNAFIVRRSEAAKPFKSKVLDSLFGEGRYGGGMTRNNLIKVASGEVVVGDEIFRSNRQMLNLLNAINDPKITDSNLKNAMGYYSGGSLASNYAGLKKPISGSSNNVIVDGISIGYQYNSGLSKKENDESLIESTVNFVEEKLRGALSREKAMMS
jgi:hypothetical protein